MTLLELMDKHNKCESSCDEDSHSLCSHGHSEGPGSKKEKSSSSVNIEHCKTEKNVFTENDDKNHDDK
jgi:hypothetical protein